MSTPPPTLGAVRPGQELAPPDAGRRRGPTSTVVLVVAAVLAFAAAAGGTFVAGRPGPVSSPTLGPVACEDGWCIPSLRADAVFAALEKRGFTCSNTCKLVSGNSTYTELAVGGTNYQVAIRTDSVQISRFEVRVRRDPDSPLSPQAEGLLTWLTVLPFGDDPEADAAARRWLTDSLGSDANVRIRGYEYRLTGSEPGEVSLTMQARPARAEQES